MGFLKRPKAPEPSAQELAGVERQARMLDEETEEIEKRLKAVARGRLGSKSLLAKAGKVKSGSASGAGSFLSGAGGTGTSSGSSGSGTRNSNLAGPGTSKK